MHVVFCIFLYISLFYPKRQLAQSLSLYTLGHDSVSTSFPFQKKKHTPGHLMTHPFSGHTQKKHEKEYTPEFRSIEVNGFSLNHENTEVDKKTKLVKLFHGTPSLYPQDLFIAPLHVCTMCMNAQVHEDLHCWSCYSTNLCLSCIPDARICLKCRF